MGKRAAESDLTPTLVTRVQALGGMVSPITLSKDIRGYNSKVPADLPARPRAGPKPTYMLWITWEELMSAWAQISASFTARGLALA